jgi:hypothetical protein
VDLHEVAKTQSHKGFFREAQGAGGSYEKGIFLLVKNHKKRIISLRKNTIKMP